MIIIDRETDGLICIQVPIGERELFVHQLRELLEGKHEVISEHNLIIKISNEFIINAQDPQCVNLSLRRTDCQELIEAFVEHINDDDDLPLDHSLEAFGAKIIPETLEDVVIETV